MTSNSIQRTNLRVELYKSQLALLHTRFHLTRYLLAKNLLRIPMMPFSCYENNTDSV